MKMQLNDNPMKKVIYNHFVLILIIQMAQNNVAKGIKDIKDIKQEQEQDNKIDNFIGHLVSGAVLTEILGTMPLLKFMNDNDIHYGMKYVDGYNKDILPFNPSRECCKGGIYITALNNCNEFSGSYGQYAREVIVGPGTRIYVEKKKFKCEEVWLGKRKPKDELIRELFNKYALTCQPGALQRIIESNVNLIQWIDPQIRTKEMRECVVERAGRMIKFIEDEYVTHEMIMKAIKNDGDALAGVKKEKITPQIIIEALKQNPSVLRCIDKNLLTIDVMKVLVKNDPWLIEDLQNLLDQIDEDEVLEPELLMIAIKQNCGVVEIFEDLDLMLTYEMRIEALKRDGMLIEYINPIERTDEINMLAVRQNGQAIQFVDQKDRTKEMILIAVKQNGNSIQNLEPKDRTQDVMMEAVKQNGKALKFIDQNDRTPEMIMEAVKQNGKAIIYIDKIQRTRELCLEACKNNGKMIKFIVKDMLTEDIIKAALKQNPNAKKYLSVAHCSVLITPDMVK